MKAVAAVPAVVAQLAKRQHDKQNNNTISKTTTG
jgi:hypothetical protein